MMPAQASPHGPSGGYTPSPRSPRHTLTTRVSIAVISAIVAAAAVITGVPHHTASLSSRAASSQDLMVVPQLTLAQTKQLEHLTPAQAAQLTTILDSAFKKFGFRVGVGSSGGTPIPEPRPISPRGNASEPGVTLTSYDWAAGVQWDHAWVIASYANLASIANNLGVVASVATAFCGKYTGKYGIVCNAIGTLIAWLLGKIHVTNWSNSHGVWAAYYWLPWPHDQVGTW
jgi:hypothetical protein